MLVLIRILCVKFASIYNYMALYISKMLKIWFKLLKALKWPRMMISSSHRNINHWKIQWKMLLEWF